MMRQRGDGSGGHSSPTVDVLKLAVGTLLFVTVAVSAGSSKTSHHWHSPCPVDDGYFQCADGSTCVSPAQQCDGRTQCSDGSDESELCRQQTCPGHCAGGGVCLRTPHGPRCRPCAAGMRLDPRDNRTCIDIDECAYDPPICSQLCNNSASGFVCSCVAGYRLADDRVHCVALPWKPDGPFLLYAQASAIYRVSVKHGASALPSVIYRSRGHVFSLAVDSDKEVVYFYDMDENAINSVGADGTNMKPFVVNGLSLVYTMDVDWLAHNLYIMDSGLKKLIICAMSTSICTSISMPSSTGTFSSIALNPHRGKMYWSECGTSASMRRIVEASMDGSNIRELVNDGVRCPTSLRLDLPLGRLYWAEHELNVIDSVAVEGTNRRKIKSRYISHPTGLAMFEEDLYWANQVNFEEDTPINKILTANKFLANNSRPTEIVSKLDDVTSELHIFHAALQIETPSACDRARCGDVCLLNDQGGYTCACSAGKKLDHDKHTCTDSWEEPSILLATKNHVLKVVPDAVGMHTYEALVAMDSNVTALTVDVAAGMLYFATASPAAVHGISVSGGNIYAVSIQNPATPSVIVSGVKTVTGMAVDWISKNLYWVDREKGTIELAKLDGPVCDKSCRTTLHGGSRRGSPMEDIRAIAVDPTQRRLYYSDCSRDFPHIGICDLAVEQCSTVTFEAPHGCVTSITVDVGEHSIYWSDSEQAVISTADLTGQHVRRIRHSLAPLSVAVIADRVFWTDLHFDDVLFHRKGDIHSREKIAVGISPLTAIVAVDVNAQPRGSSMCTDTNGDCSHICVPFSQRAVRCLCPSSLVLSSDRKTCTDTGGGEQATRRAPVFITRPPTTKALRSLFRPMNLPREPCAGGFCANGGTCTMFTGRAVCLCPAGTTGVRCQNVTSSSSKAEASSAVTISQIVGVWIAVVIVALAVIALAAAVVYCLRKNGYLNKPAIAQFKQVVFGSSADSDEHKAKLVDPTYENPGYVDADDDEFSEKRGPVRLSATAAIPGELVSAGHNDYTYIRKLDTADP